MKTNLLKLTCGLARLGAAATAGAQSPVSLLFNPLRLDRRNQFNGKFNGKLWLAVFVGCAMLLLEALPAQAVSYDTTTTTVSGSPNPSTSGQSVTFTATVTRTTTHSGTTTPTGTVMFLDGATTLGAGSLSGSGLVATTTFSTNGLTGGSHTITANYLAISLLPSSGTCTQTVNSVFVITTQPVSAVLAVGQPASLSVTNTGTAPLGYQWLKDGGILPGQTNAMLTYASFQFTNSGSYLVVITNAQGMVISLPASLSVTNAILKGWGYNGYGQLCNAWQSQTLPITLASNVVSMVAGDVNSLFVTADGTLWGMGNNSYGPGELGLGALTSTRVPLVVASNVVAVASGTGNSFFIKADGTLWGMGNNTRGSLGIGTFNSTNLPTYVTNNVVAVAVGQYQTLFVKADGTLWAMGANSNGQLGNGNTSQQNLPVAVASNVVAVAGGGAHSLFMKADGTLWGMGQNTSGQLGLGTLTGTNRPTYLTNNVVSIACGGFHSLFVKADGTLWGMGDNTYGQLGNGTTIATNRPIYVTNNVAMAAGGSGHSLFIKADGTLWAMGWNYYGTLGNGTAGNTSYPNVAPVSGGLLAASLANKGGCLGYHCLAIAGVPPMAGALTNQTATFGQSASFTVTVTNGDGPFTYQWQRSGTNLAGATAATYTLASAALTDAGSYAVLVASTYGSTTSASATLAVNKAEATVTLTSLSQTYDGTAKAATATTSPANLTVTLTYDGWVSAPSDAGSYTVIGTVAEANYAGSATNTLVIAKAPATVTLGNLSQTYDGTAKSATASTTPDGLTVALTYNGSAAAPVNAGNYRVIGTVVDASYAGSGTNMLVIGQAGQVIIFSPLAAVVYGDPPLTLSASASSGLPVSYASADTAIATVSGNTVTVLTAGSTVLTASQVGDANYLAATNVSQTLVVSDLLMGLSIQMQTNGVSHITTNHLGRLITNYDYQPGLTVTGNLGRDYTIQYCEDLIGTNWSVLTTLTNLPVSPYQVTDPATNPARFYRLRQP